MRSSSGGINIAASAQTLDVDNRISLRYYFRIADNILKQAAIFREEGNFIDLYVMLLRFSSLSYETIPRHRDYRASPQSKKNLLKKKLLNAVSELEELKPRVLKKIDELNRKSTFQPNGWSDGVGKSSYESSSVPEWSPFKRKGLISHDFAKAEFSCQGSRNQQLLQVRHVVPQFQRLSLGTPLPKEETLSKHSILGTSGLLGQWKPPSSDKRVQYPSNIDLTPVDIPSLQQPVEAGALTKKESGQLETERLHLESLLAVSNNAQKNTVVEPCSMISFDTTESPQIDIIKQPSPPAVLADVQDLIPAISSQVTATEHEMEKPLSDVIVQPEAPLELHVPTTMMENFMTLAKSNTEKNLETCGILAGQLKNRKFYITTLIIPKQESTSDTCQATNEEEIFEVQDKRSLFPLGWIHTHPSQSCFMSSVDVHTHYSYQIMLPEAIAIVMAPRDTSRAHGIFRLTTPGGMSVIRQCQQRGFHAHDQPPDGGPIYKHCTDVYMNPNLKFDVVDLR